MVAILEVITLGLSQDILALVQLLWINAISLLSQLLEITRDITIESLKDNATITIFIFAASASIIIWYLNERKRRSIQEYKQKEKRYIELIELIEKLKPDEKPSDHLRDEFLHQINLCWLYCPDNVVRKIAELISKLNNDNISQEAKDSSMNELMITLRKDIRKKTKLNQDDYKKIKPAMLRHIVFKVESGKIEIKGSDAILTHTDKNSNIIPPPNNGTPKEEH
jgi:hypothetical protein